MVSLLRKFLHMEIKTLKCNNCGGDLSITPQTKFFNCSFCGSSLTIKKPDDAVFAEVLVEIKENTDNTLDNSEALLIEKEIARLDREWTLKREEYKIQGAERFPDEGTRLYGITSIVVGGVFLFLFLIAGLSWSGFGSGFFILFGIIGLGIVILSGVISYTNASNYQYQKGKYLKQRSLLLKKITYAK